MTRDWESTFANWTGPASDAEQQRYERTRDAINQALRDSSQLADYSFNVYPKGSYPNFTNVVRDSDVDIAAELTEFIRNDFVHDAQGLTLGDLGKPQYTGGYTLAAFKDDVEAALTAAFGSTAVDRGNKAIHIRESSQSLAADVVPCVTHRTYIRRDYYREGIQLRNDARPLDHIINYPRQHLEAGTAKNGRTDRRYKRVVRILKRLENEMVEEGLLEEVPSFLIESATWNTSSSAFLNPDNWMGRVREVLAQIFNGTLSNECVQSDDWLEANGIKYLFHSSQPWTYQQAHSFAHEAWEYVGFE